MPKGTLTFCKIARSS